MAKRSTANRTIEVIMLQNDKHLGEKYEIVRVKPIFARNVLFPNKIAILADKEAKNNYAQKMEAAKISREKKAASLEDLFSKITADGGIEITRKANKDNTLYAKVDENDIAEKIKEVYGIITFLLIPKRVRIHGQHPLTQISLIFVGKGYSRHLTAQIILKALFVSIRIMGSISRITIQFIKSNIITGI